MSLEILLILLVAGATVVGLASFFIVPMSKKRNRHEHAAHDIDNPQRNVENS